MSDLERVEAALEEKVRPALRAHGGDIAIDRLEGKTLYVKMLGQCAGCPSADLTNETVVEAELTAALPEAVRTEMAKDIPAGRAGQPEDVANAVAFFAAEQSSYLTGQVLCVDGGMAM